jgi:hypothetical protein
MHGAKAQDLTVLHRHVPFVMAMMTEVVGSGAS